MCTYLQCGMVWLLLTCETQLSLARIHDMYFI